jgi:hypothetical protein
VEGKGNDQNEKKHSLGNARVEIHASKDPFDTKGKKGRLRLKKRGYMTMPLGCIISSQLGAPELLTRKFDKQMWYY